MSAAHLVTQRADVSPDLSSDTWGISGPDFLAGYVVLGLAVLATVVSATRHRRVPGTHAIPAERLTPGQLGLLGGGDLLAITVALAELRRHDLVDSLGTPKAPVDPSGRPLLHKPATGLDSVSRAVLDAIADDAAERLTPGALLRTPAVAAALGAERRAWPERQIARFCSNAMATTRRPASCTPSSTPLPTRPARHGSHDRPRSAAGRARTSPRRRGRATARFRSRFASTPLFTRSCAKGRATWPGTGQCC